MKKQIKFWSVLMMIVLASSYAMAVEKTTVQQAEATDQLVIGAQDVVTVSDAAAVQKPAETSNQLVIGAQDVITASDAGGGYMTTRDILLVVIIIFAIIGLIYVL